MYTVKRIKVFLHLSGAYALLTAFFVCLFLCGCTDNELVGEIPLPEENTAAVISLNVKQQTPDQVRTRAVDENSISNLHILVYNGSGGLIGYKYLNSYSGQFTMDVNSGTNCTIYAIANLGSTPVLNAQTANTKSALQAMMCGPIATLDGVATNGRLVMSGSLTGVTLLGGGTINNVGSINISRLVARNTFTVTPIPGINITGYSIKNLPKYEYLVARPNANESSATDIAVGDDARISDRFDMLPIVPTTSISGLTFYMFENRRGGRVVVNGSTGTLSDQKEKSMYAPNYATYLEIYATGTLEHPNVNARFISAIYRVYLGADNSQNYNVKRNGSYNYIVNINSATDIDTRVTKVSSPSNCYIVPPNRAVIFPVSRANQDGTTRITNLNSGWTASLLWTDKSGYLTPGGTIKTISDLGDGTIKVETGSAEGNAVVVVKVGGVIKWSWHIWVTNYDPNNAINQASNNGNVFMNRNLGAINNTPQNAGALGLLYQWGRKDPFIGSSSFSSSLDAPVYGPANAAIYRLPAPRTYSNSYPEGPPNNIENSIQNPSTFYYKTEDTGGPNEYDWYATTADHNNNLWGGNGSKSVYDPSPEGWRVPKSGSGPVSPWFGLSNTGFTFINGYNWTSSVGWYPAAGYRFYKTDGYLTGVGSIGAYWSATVTADNGNTKDYVYTFYFDNSICKVDYLDDKNVSFSAFRACALPIRCVKE